MPTTLHRDWHPSITGSMGVYGPHSFEARASDAKQRNALLLIVAIIGAGLWLRHSLTPSYGWIVVILLGAAGWLIHRANGTGGDDTGNPIAADAMSVELGYREKQILRLLLRG